MMHNTDLSQRYIELLKLCVLGAHTLPPELAQAGGAFGTPSQKSNTSRWWRRSLAKMIENRFQGKEFPRYADTMIGRARLDNLHFCVESALENGVEGDLIETGVWRGGATILMRGILQAFGVTDRTVWVADSFQGLPPPLPEFPQDRFSVLDEMDVLRVSQDQVKANFQKYRLLDEQVRFLPGFFEETLEKAPISQLAVMRLDGDMYSSTIVALRALYKKLSPGGYVIIDDYHALQSCKQAVEDFRNENKILDPISPIDWTGAFWQKEGNVLNQQVRYGAVHNL